MDWSNLEQNIGPEWATTVFPSGPEPELRQTQFGSRSHRAIIIPVILRPSFYISKGLGISPCTHQTSGDGKVSGSGLSWPEAAFSFIGLGCLVFASYTIMNGLYHIFSTFDAGFKVYVLLIQMFLSGVAGGVSLLVSLWESANLDLLQQDIIQTVNQADVISCIKPRSLSVHFRPTRTMAFLGLTLATYIIELGNYINYHHILSKWVTLWQLIPVAWVLFIPVVVDSTFSTCCFLLDRGFESLMTAVHNLRHARHNVKEVRRLHLQLLDQCGNLSSLFGVQLLFILIHVRLQIITDLFLVLAELRRNQFATSSIMSLTSLCIRVGRMVYCPEIVYEQVYAVDKVDQRVARKMRRIPALLLPSFISCKIFGCLILSTSPSERKFSRWIGVAAFVLITISVSITCYNFCSHLSWQRPRNVIPFILDIFPKGVHLLGCVTCTFSAVAKAHKLYQCVITEIKLFHRGKWLTRGFKTARNRLGNLLLVCTLYVFIVIKTAQFKIPSGGSVIITLSIWWAGMAPTAIESLFIALLVLHKETICSLTSVFHQISNGFLPEDTFKPKRVKLVGNCVKNAEFIGMTDLERELSMRLILRLYIRLGKVTHLLNDTFGFQLLLGLTFCRIEILNCLYMAIGRFVSNRSCFVEISMFSELSIRVISLVVASQAVLSEERKFARVIGQVDPSNWDNRAYEQFQVLQRQVTSLKPRFTTCGVFILDYELLQEIASTTTTYLIVLVQFQIWKF